MPLWLVRESDGNILAACYVILDEICICLQCVRRCRVILARTRSWGERNVDFYDGINHEILRITADRTADETNASVYEIIRVA